ncbi:MAG: CPBP family intramembrane metalloprotease [Oscillospiraceae bacterium]|nr:CPBP family intramembrane metalloprotease [Oscillospiraceae bacterium]
MQQEQRPSITSGTFWYFAAATVLFPFVYSRLQRLIIQLGAAFVSHVSPTHEIADATWLHNLALLNILPGVVYLLLIIGFWMLIRHTRFHLPGQFNLKVSPEEAVKGFFCGITLWMSTVFFFTIFSIAFPSETAHAEYVERMAMLTRSPWIFQFIFTVIMAPIVEEVAFRAGMFAASKKIMPLKAALALQAIAFGVIHLDFSRQYWNFQQGIYAAVIGVLLAYIYHRTGSLMAVIIVHMSFNGSNYFIAPLLTRLGGSGILGSMIMLLLFPASIVASVFLVKGPRSRINTKGTTW